MNERQALTQESLSKGKDLGTSSSKENTAGSTNEGGGSTISKKTFQQVLAFAIFLDSASLLINLIPIVGGVVATVFIWIPGMMALFIIYLKLGVPFHFKNSMKFAGCNVIEMIPILNALPGFTLSVIVNLGPLVKKEEGEGGMFGGNSVQSKIQQALSKTVQK